MLFSPFILPKFTYISPWTFPLGLLKYLLYLSLNWRSRIFLYFKKYSLRLSTLYIVFSFYTLNCLLRCKLKPIRLLLEGEIGSYFVALAYRIIPVPYHTLANHITLLLILCRVYFFLLSSTLHKICIIPLLSEGEISSCSVINLAYKIISIYCLLIFCWSILFLHIFFSRLFFMKWELDVRSFSPSPSSSSPSFTHYHPYQFTGSAVYFRWSVSLSFSCVTHSFIHLN